MVDHDEFFRRLALGDERYLDALVARRRAGRSPSGLDHARAALVRLGALAATDGSDLCWQHTVAAALDAGITIDELVDTLIVLTTPLGVTQLVSIAPKFALAAGFDVDAALETMAPPASGGATR